MQLSKQHAPKQIDPAKALVCFVINVFATPGLGSLIAGRVAVGIVQFTLGIIGAGLIVGWITCLVWDNIRIAAGEAPIKMPYSWAGKYGVIVFGLAWLWALITSISILREAKQARRTGQDSVSTDSSADTSLPKNV